MYDSWIMDEIVHWICLIFPFFSSLSTNLYCTYYSDIKYVEVATGFLFWNADEFHTFLFRLQVSLSFLGVGWLSCCFMHVVHYRFSGSLCSYHFDLHGCSSCSLHQLLMRLLYGPAADLFGIGFLVDNMVLFLGVSMFWFLNSNDDGCDFVVFWWLSCGSVFFVPINYIWVCNFCQF